mmetsp:Transcript_13894/g.33659  ORF Transcript_13894/g.33659 Transcript_13894/m.33659 type:complete len:200 (+) Transcript_13894:402-1001(+)
MTATNDDENAAMLARRSPQPRVPIAATRDEDRQDSSRAQIGAIQSIVSNQPRSRYCPPKPSYAELHLGAKTPSTIRIVRGFTRGNRPQDTIRERHQATSSAGLANQLSPKPQPPRTTALATDHPLHEPTHGYHATISKHGDAMMGRVDTGVKWGVVPPASAALLKRSVQNKEKDDGVERVPRSGPLRCDKRIRQQRVAG